MKISYKKLTSEAESTGFRPEVLEKVLQLLELLEAIQEHPFLRGKLVLKGGTALNLFIFNAPRLSVDIDLNYIGAEGLEEMLEERPKIEKALQAVFARQGFNIRRMPREHAGGKWSLRYESAIGEGGNLEVDLNFMHRIPLWPVSLRDSYPIGSWRTFKVPVLDIHELAVGKLAALFARTKARDLFDSQRILSMKKLDPKHLRIGFLVYGAMNRKDWRTVSVKNIKFDASELENQLIPTLRTRMFKTKKQIMEFGEQMGKACRENLSVVLPFTDNEHTFLDLLLDKGLIEPSLLTSDAQLQRNIQNQPLLKWKAQNVRKYKGLAENT